MVYTMYGTPSAYTRYWIPTLASYFALKWSLDYGLKRKADIRKALEEAGRTARDFAFNWIWEPMLRVWDTIRLKDERLSILGKEALQSDLNVKHRFKEIMLLPNVFTSFCLVVRANGRRICKG